MPRKINVQKFVLALLVQRQMDNIQSLIEHTDRHTVEQGQQDLTYCVQRYGRHTIGTAHYTYIIYKKNMFQSKLPVLKCVFNL